MASLGVSGRHPAFSARSRCALPPPVRGLGDAHPPCPPRKSGAQPCFPREWQGCNVCDLRAGDRWSRSTARAPAGRAAGGGVATHQRGGSGAPATIIDGIWRRDTNILALGDGLSRPAQHDRCFDVKIVDGWRASGSGWAARLLARLPRASLRHARCRRARERLVPRALSARHDRDTRPAAVLGVHRLPESLVTLDVLRVSCGRSGGLRAGCRGRGARARVASCVPYTSACRGKNRDAFGPRSGRHATFRRS